MTPYEQALGKSGKEKSLLTGRNLEQNRAREGAAICHEHLGVMGGRQDKIYTESENLPSYIFCDHLTLTEQKLYARSFIA